jgi:hypothetical protein
MSLFTLVLVFSLSLLLFSAYFNKAQLWPNHVTISFLQSDTNRSETHVRCISEEDANSPIFAHSSEHSVVVSADSSTAYRALGEYGCFGVPKGGESPAFSAAPCGIVVHAVVEPHDHVTPAFQHRLEAFFSDVLDEVARWKTLSFVAHLPVAIVTNHPRAAARLIAHRSINSEQVRAVWSPQQSGVVPTLLETALLTPFNMTLLVNSSIRLPMLDFAVAPPTVLLPLLEWFSVLLVPLPGGELCGISRMRLYHPGLMLFRVGHHSHVLFRTAQERLLRLRQEPLAPAYGDEEFQQLVYALADAVADSGGVGLAEVDPAFCVDRHRFPNDHCSRVRNKPPKLNRLSMDWVLTRCDHFRI